MMNGVALETNEKSKVAGSEWMTLVADKNNSTTAETNGSSASNTSENLDVNHLYKCREYIQNSRRARFAS